MKVLFDLNIMLDYLLFRSPWYVDAAALWDANRDGKITAHVAAFSIPTVFYIVRKQTDLGRAERAVDDCLASLTILPVDRPELEYAPALPGSDFEDNLQIACAVQAGVDAIATRDPRGFSHSPVPAFTLADLLARLGSSPPTP
jgi:predicted nucleic acid-binding protein